MAKAPQNTPSEPGVKHVNVALQGGGAHGAFTWGVLDALLADGRIKFEGISGTSAGAMNAVCLADGMREGTQAARDQLKRFWRAISTDGAFSRRQRTYLDAWMSMFGGPMTGINWFGNLTNYFSPYQLNPFDLNPLRDVVEREIDFEAVRKTDHLKLFIAATNVYTGKVRVFRREELTLDMVMASACLPTVYKSVMIDGEPYWDGGFGGNPVLYPFFAETETLDIILIQVNPVERHQLPESSHDIMERMNEITFNAPLLLELRAIDFVGRLIDEGRLTGTHYKKIRMHRIEAHDELNKFGADTKMNAEYDFLRRLRDIGRAAGERFLSDHYQDVGVRGTFNIRKEFA
ncbi:patatin-like phospholipase family protein [Methylovirgula sp. 4M-Z18]|uniref:patatin-like phospholipase family protein n=1 Tax=Methylovirgula sp. 4M-Z18 TaxID=2293567 RepID=UPI000E2ED35A|nr:patatin-like phospholipase family protein [Methylovirgula sp. 4M-Z18]RFB79917.1 patatin-like phospholipase family protein [Methylovirgula sp. 4M-Z18]